MKLFQAILLVESPEILALLKLPDNIGLLSSGGNRYFQMQSSSLSSSEYLSCGSHSMARMEF